MLPYVVPIIQFIHFIHSADFHEQIEIDCDKIQQQYHVVLMSLSQEGSDWESGDGQAGPLMCRCMGGGGGGGGDVDDVVGLVMWWLIKCAIL